MSSVRAEITVSLTPKCRNCSGLGQKGTRSVETPVNDPVASDRSEKMITGSSRTRLPVIGGDFSKTQTSSKQIGIGMS